MRYLIVCLLLTGCGATSMLSPGTSPRDAVLSRVRSASVLGTLPATQADCIVNYYAANMSDEQFRKADAAMATGGSDPVFLNMAKLAPDACIK
jgi:hypothetical protein